MPYNGPSTDRTQYDADRDAQVAAVALAEQEKYEEAMARQEIEAERAAELAEHSEDKDKMLAEKQKFDEKLAHIREERQKAVEESQKAAEEGRQYPPHVIPPEPVAEAAPEPAPEGEHNNPGFFDIPATEEDPNDPPSHHKKGKHR